jgi:hypothetical protein
MMRQRSLFSRVRAAVFAASVLAAGCTSNSVVGSGMDAGSDVQCTAGQTACGGACVDPRTSAQHCGACGTACPGGNVCVNGACMQSCPGAQTLCNGNLCVSTAPTASTAAPAATCAPRARCAPTAPAR